MSNEKEYNYETITQPYNGMLERTGNQTSTGSFNNAPMDYNSPIPNPIDKDLVLNEKNFDNIWISKSIKSKNYIPKKRGFLIDGINGNIEFSGVVAASMIKMLVYDYEGETTGGPEGSKDYDEEGYMYVRINYSGALNDNFRVFIGESWRSVTTT